MRASGDGESPDPVCSLLSGATVSASGLDTEGAGCLGAQQATSRQHRV